jgi:hypothetical protein
MDTAAVHRSRSRARFDAAVRVAAGYALWPLRRRRHGREHPRSQHAALVDRHRGPLRSQSDPGGGATAASVTVVGDSLTWVDIEATAAFAQGTEAR